MTGRPNRWFKGKERLVGPQKVGINSASTFNGFCNPHDTSLFKPIESKIVDLTPEVAFLSLFRGIAYEHYQKRAERTAADILREADAGWPLWKQGDHQSWVNNYIQGIEIALSELGDAMSDLNRRFFENNFAEIYALETTFESFLPIATAFAYHPEFDFNGNRLQSLAYENLQYMTVTTAVRDEKTVVTFAWMGGFESAAGKFARSFRGLDPSEKATAFARFCFIHAENWHLRPSWWSGLSDPGKSEIHKLMRRGLPSDDGARLADDYQVRSSAFVIETKAIYDQILQ